MSDISINPAALHIVANALTNKETRTQEDTVATNNNSDAVISNVRKQDNNFNEKIKTSTEAQAATAESSRLIKSDIDTALIAQANNLPSEVLELLGD